MYGALPLLFIDPTVCVPCTDIRLYESQCYIVNIFKKTGLICKAFIPCQSSQQREPALLCLPRQMSADEILNIHNFVLH